MNSASREKERERYSVSHGAVCPLSGLLHVCYLIWVIPPLLPLSTLSPDGERTVSHNNRLYSSSCGLSYLGGSPRYRPVPAAPPYHLNHRDTKERSGRVSLSFLRGTRISYICSPDLSFWTAVCGCVKAVSTAGCCCYLSFFFLLLLHSEQILHRDEDSGTLVEELKGARVWLSLVYFYFLILNRALCRLVIRCTSTSLFLFCQRGVTVGTHKGSRMKSVCREDAVFSIWTVTTLTPVVGE